MQKRHGARQSPFTRPVEDQYRELVASCEIDHSVPPSLEFRGRTSKRGKQRLRHFLEHNLRRYARRATNRPSNATSNLSPYLHFGHISSLEVALAVREYAAEHKLIADEFLEELIVRRELAFNFARFTAESGRRSRACRIGRRQTLAQARARPARSGLLARSV